MCVQVAAYIQLTANVLGNVSGFGVLLFYSFLDLFWLVNLLDKYPNYCCFPLYLAAKTINYDSTSFEFCHRQLATL